MDKKTKQSSETLDFDITASDWLSDGDYITGATSVVTPSGLTIVSTTAFLDGTRVKVLMSGGVNGVKYKVTTTATTHDGLVKEKDFYMVVKDI